jgi:transcriptional regulator of PTS gene
MRIFTDIAETENRPSHKIHLLKQVIHAFLQEKELSIPEVCHQYGWSVPTGTKLVQELVRKKILVKKGKRDSNGGRRPDIFSLNGSMGYVIGIEMLLQSFKLSIVNFNHEIVYEYSSDTFDITDTPAAMAFLLDIVPETIRTQKISKDKILGVGIGITGRINKKAGVSHTYLNLEEPIQQILSEKWHLPVYIDNDTHLMALGEMNFGYARDKSDVIIVNLSQGIGTSIISNGRIHDGKSGFAGEFGHIHIANNNRLCVCGKKGCLETVVSGLALENNYSLLGPVKPRAKRLPYKQILQLAKKNDEKAAPLINEMGEQLGQALSIPIHLLNPELIIIGGSFTVVGEKMIYPIARGMNLYGLPQLVAECDLKISSLGENAAMLGAFSMVFNQEFK